MNLLIVDDQPGLASGLAQWLVETGWPVPGVALSGAEAIAWVNQHGLDVLISDVVMQPMDGFTLRDTLLPHLPGLRTIFISGYDLTDYAPILHGATVLAKPVTGEQLDQALRDLFEPPNRDEPAPAVAAVSPKVEAKLPADQFVGRTLGNYLIEAKLEEGPQGGIYRATQTAMGRMVRLYLLDPVLAHDPVAVENFMASASMKANVAHPYIFTVFEAGQIEGVYYYSSEYIPCRSLKQIEQSGEFLDEVPALRAMKVAAETLAYFYQNNIPHSLIDEEAILITGNKRTRIANIAVSQPAFAFDQSQEMAELGRVIAGSLPEDSPALPARELGLSLAAGTAGIETWATLVQRVEALEPQVAPEDAYKLEEQERLARSTAEEARKRQLRGLFLTAGVVAVLVMLFAGALYWMLYGRQVKAREFKRMVEIPAGAFIYQNGQTVTLPKFFIDEYEVTIAQYAKFLDYLQQYPDEAAKFDDPAQPKGKSHVPVGWADQDLPTGAMPGYYTRAKRYGRYHYAALDVNCPVFGVDWFDAAAYAKWKGHRLPTEQEWEKAARGVQGNKYPWGNSDDIKRVNSGVDTDADPSKGGSQDGFDHWSPVDAMTRDKSPFGVMDMAGNVSEWTASMDTDPMLASQKVPVIRGGNWRTLDYSLTRRVLKLNALQSDEALGFRTVSDTIPSK